MIETDVDAETITRGPRPVAVRLIQRDYDSGDEGGQEAAGSRSEFKGFSWDDLVVEANMEIKTSTKW